MNKSILSISLDTNIIKPEYGDSLLRQKEYAKYFENFTIIILNTQKNKLPRQKHFNNLHIYSLNSTSKYFYIFNSIVLIKLLNKKYHFDLVSSQDPLITGLTAYITKLILKIPFNLQLHSVFCFDKKQKYNLIYSLIINFIVSKADSIRTVIPNLISKKNKLVKKISQIIDLDFFYNEIRNKPKPSKFIFIGRLAKEKNIPFLINSFNVINQKYPSTSLTIVGEGPEKIQTKILIDKLELKNKIKLTGFLTKSQIKKELLNNDILVLTSIYEGWPAVIIEAGSAGLPIISTNVGGINKIIKNNKNGLLIESKNSIQLTQAMEYLINNPQECFNLSQNLQKKIFSNYSKEKLLNEWINLLKNTK